MKHVKTHHGYAVKKWNQLTKPASLSLCSASHLTAWMLKLYQPQSQFRQDAASRPSSPVLCCCRGARCDYSFALIDCLEQVCIQSMYSIGRLYLTQPDHSAPRGFITRWNTKEVTWLLACWDKCSQVRIPDAQGHWLLFSGVSLKSCGMPFYLNPSWSNYCSKGEAYGNHHSD